MRVRLLNTSLITIVMAGLLALPLYTQSRAEGAYLATSPQTHSLKKPKSPDFDTHTQKKQNIVRKKKKHRPAIVTPIARVPPLSIQWWVIAEGEDNVEELTDPNRMFNKGDRIRFGFKVNQPGFLYIINGFLAQDGTVIDLPHIIFPDSQANRGQNVFTKSIMNKEYYVPAYCKGIPDPNDCWLEIDGPAGKDVFTVIFSREMITDLDEQIKKADDRVSKTLIEELMADTVKDLEKKPMSPIYPKVGKTGASQTNMNPGNFYITRITNRNLKDNEEIVFSFNINHRD